MTVRGELSELVRKNKENKETQDAYSGWYNPSDLVNERVDTS